MVWLSFVQMHHVYRCYPSEISRAAKKRSPKIKLGEGWGLLGSQVTGLSWGKAGQEPRGGTEAAWGSIVCWLAPLDCSAAFFTLQGSTHGICALNEQSHGNTPTDPAQASPMEAVPTLRFPFPRCVKVPTEAKCAGCRGKDSKVWGWGTRILGSILKFNKCEINSFTSDVISVLWPRFISYFIHLLRAVVIRILKKKPEISLILKKI